MVSGRRHAESTNSYVDINKIGHGAMFKKHEGITVADFTSRVLIRWQDGSLSITNRAPKRRCCPGGTLPEQWIKACKNPSLKTACDFEYSADMIEQIASVWWLPGR